MNHIKVKFSIKDLENLSEVKAHTIRIWEKRYSLLAPKRTDTNIRYYTLDSLKKILNVAFLNKNGYKISKIANFSEEEFNSSLQSLVNSELNKDDFINNLKIAMLNFDVQHFEITYQRAINEFNFSKVFNNYFIPFLSNIGLLWQSGSINPTHEHFISNLIKQKTLLQIEKYQLLTPARITNKFFILFLPDNEVHDLGLTYIHYEILKNGYKAIMLGASVPLECLEPFLLDDKEVVFVSYFTVSPAPDKIEGYLNDFSIKILNNSKSTLSVLGKQIACIENKEVVNNKINLYSSINNFIEKELN